MPRCASVASRLPFPRPPGSDRGYSGALPPFSSSPFPFSFLPSTRRRPLSASGRDFPAARRAPGGPRVSNQRPAANSGGPRPAPLKRAGPRRSPGSRRPLPRAPRPPPPPAPRIGPAAALTAGGRPPAPGHSGSVPAGPQQQPPMAGRLTCCCCLLLWALRLPHAAGGSAASRPPACPAGRAPRGGSPPPPPALGGLAQDMVAVHMLKLYEKYNRHGSRPGDGNTVRSFKATPGKRGSGRRPVPAWGVRGLHGAAGASPGVPGAPRPDPAAPCPQPKASAPRESPWRAAAARGEHTGGARGTAGGPAPPPGAQTLPRGPKPSPRLPCGSGAARGTATGSSQLGR